MPQTDDRLNSEDRLTAVDVADAFSLASKSLVRAFNERLAAQGVDTVSAPRSRVLAEVFRLGPVRLTEVAIAVGVTQGTVSSLVEGLVNDGLVQRETDLADRRSTQLSVTPAGRATAEKWLQAYARAAEELFAPVPEEQWPMLVRMLSALS